MAIMRAALRFAPRQPLHFITPRTWARPLSSTRALRLKEDKQQSPEQIEKAKQEQMKTGNKKEELESASESVVGADREEVGNHDKHMKELQQEGAKESQKKHPEGKA